MNIVIGLIAAGGALLVGHWVGARRHNLDRRVYPYLKSFSADSTLDGRGGVDGVVARILGPVWTDVVRWYERWGNPSSTLERRIDRAGGTESVDRFRFEQLMWAAGGFVLSLLWVVLSGATQGFDSSRAIVLVVVGTLAGFFGRDALLTRSIRSRERLLEQQLPVATEMLALAVSAGETIGAALERTVTTCSGEISRVLRAVVADVHAGQPLPDALRKLADRTGVPSLARFCDGLAVAIERGTPVVELLHAQALDIRAAGRRRMMTEGGKREIAMMVPVVFLILPVTVMFAVYPGIVAIRLGN